MFVSFKELMKHQKIKTSNCLKGMMMKIYYYDFSKNRLIKQTIEEMSLINDSFVFESKDFYFWNQEIYMINPCGFTSLYELTNKQIEKIKNKIERLIE